MTISRFPIRWLIALSLSTAFAEPIPFPSLARFDAAAQTTVQNRLAQPFDAATAVRLALLQHPEVRNTLLDLGTTPNALLAAGWLHEGKLDLWQELIGNPSQLDDRTSKLVQNLLHRSQIVQEAWYRAAAAEALRPALTDQQTATEALMELARSRRDASNLSRLDEATALAEVGDTRLEVMEERQTGEMALLDLRRELGINPDTPLKLAPLPTPPAGIPRFKGLLELAKQYNLPLRHVLNTLSQDRSVSEQNTLRQTVPTLPLFSGKNALGHKENQLGTRLAAETDVHELASKLTELESKLALAQQRWQALAQEILPQRQAASTEALKHYNGMLRGVDELLKSRMAELATQQRLIIAQRDYWLAWLALESLVGGKLPTPNYEQPTIKSIPSIIEAPTKHH
ncbi:hypothetical protein ACUHMQ_10120 [Chitinimonas sp. PSY-7]|uniref:hypothetical protein n=1 Tax=Chitinimonas sp. PSY-7 TaxID=3459088 RepID=UPI0040400065